MAFISPVIRKDFQLYGQCQSANYLALQKRRCASASMISFAPTQRKDAQNHTVTSDSLLLTPPPTPPIVNAPPALPSISTELPRVLQEQSEVSRHDWLFPNKHVYTTPLQDDGEIDLHAGASGAKKQVRFGRCEWLRYDYELEEGSCSESGEAEERITVESNEIAQTKTRRTRPRRASIPAHEWEEVELDGDKRPGLSQRKTNTTCSSSPIFDEEMEEGEELVPKANNRYNAMMFRLISALCTSKM